MDIRKGKIMPKIENPQIEHGENCEFRAEGIDNENWRGEWGYCSCSGYPQVKCRRCGAIIDEVYEVIDGGDDDIVVTEHHC